MSNTDPILELDKPLGERSNEALREQERRLVEVRKQMVGSLYPAIVTQQVADIRAELLHRQTGHREIVPGVSVRTGPGGLA